MFMDDDYDEEKNKKTGLQYKEGHNPIVPYTGSFIFSRHYNQFQ